MPRERASCSLDSFSLHSSFEENQEQQSGVSIEEDVVELNSKVSITIRPDMRLPPSNGGVKFQEFGTNFVIVNVTWPHHIEYIKKA